MTLYLSRLRLDPRSARVRAELRSPYEMHRTLAKSVAPPSLPPAEARAALARARLLFRADEDARSGCVTLLVQSRTPPDWSELTIGPDYLLAPPQTKAFDPLLTVGQRLAFRLRANPTVKRDGKRLGLHGEAEQRAWLQRKAEQGGFAVERAISMVEQRSLRSPRQGREMEFLAVRFDGVLRVVEPERFAETLAAGIGSAKAFGFGLLSVAPVRSGP